MSHYAIGDLQGCYREFQALLAHIGFNPGRDTLYPVGDLVNRGPDSLACLRYIKRHESSILPVLGNHDLHLLAVCHGYGQQKRQDTLQAILAAPDRALLTGWLQQQPLLREYRDTFIVHAGVFPHWDDRETRLRAEETACFIRTRPQDYFAAMYGNSPDTDPDGSDTLGRLRFATNVFTRMRVLHRDGRLDFQFKSTLTQLPDHLLPWFRLPRKQTAANIVFGHWSTLGLHRENRTVCTDSGALWGGSLTAVDLDSGETFQVASTRRKAHFSP